MAFSRQPCGTSCCSSISIAEILLKGAAEEHQLGWSMRAGRFFYFGKAQPHFYLCIWICRTLVPAVPYQSQVGTVVPALLARQFFYSCLWRTSLNFFM